MSRTWFGAGGNGFSDVYVYAEPCAHAQSGLGAHAQSGLAGCHLLMLHMNFAVVNDILECQFKTSVPVRCSGNVLVRSAHVSRLFSQSINLS